MLTVANKGKAISIKTLTRFPCYFYLFIIALWRCIKQKQRNTLCAPHTWCCFLSNRRPAEVSPPPLRCAAHTCLLLLEAFTGESKNSLKELFFQGTIHLFKMLLLELAPNMNENGLILITFLPLWKNIRLSPSHTNKIFLFFSEKHHCKWG